MSPLLFVLAFIWRRLLFRTTFIGITGSCGKTTVKECLAAILASRHPTFRTYRNQNAPSMVALNILRVRPWHRFAVIEAATRAPGMIRKGAAVLRPDVAVILNVLRTHERGFDGLKEYAAEKAALLRALAPGGVAVLNLDDPCVAEMAASASVRVRTFGTSPGADLRASQVQAKWPERLALQVRCGPETQTVETQLVGAHWLTSVLAALAVADTLGVPLREAASILREVQPFSARMQPVQLPSGAVVLRDDYNASADPMEASLRVLQEARATRRILVITDIDVSGKRRILRLRQLALIAAQASDMAVIIGAQAAYGRRRAIEAGMAPENVYAFPSLRPAADFLKTELRSGDLLLLKGRATDHIARVFHALLGPVRCWKERCPKTMLCDECWEL
jgi:UDP-N-acetylmuramoyl-tripeptide--D-alanyl-D-alanine ligase